MNTYYFLEREAWSRIAESRRWAERDRLAILAQQGPCREAQTLKPCWITALHGSGPRSDSPVGTRSTPPDS